MPKSLADGRRKLTLLTTKPANPAKPTAAELNGPGAIDASCSILSSDFTWSATDSDKVAEKELCKKSNANSLGASNFQAGITPFRYRDEATGASAPDEGDDVFQATKVKGTELWGYLRNGPDDATEPWAADDEIALGMHVITDEPQAPSDLGGYFKYRVPMEPQDGWPFITVAAGA